MHTPHVVVALLFTAVAVAAQAQQRAPSAAAAPTPPQGLFPRDDAGRIRLQEVAAVDGISAAELYSRAKAWAALTYKSGKDVVQLDDKEAGRLVVKGNLGRLRHTVVIEVKDGRYRYTISGLLWVNPPPNNNEVPLEDLFRKDGEPKLGERGFLEKVHGQLVSLAANLKAAMTKPEEKW